MTKITVSGDHLFISIALTTIMHIEGSYLWNEGVLGPKSSSTAEHSSSWSPSATITMTRKHRELVWNLVFLSFQIEDLETFIYCNSYTLSVNLVFIYKF